MKGQVAFWTIFLVLVMVPATFLIAEEWVIFEEEVLHGGLSRHDGVGFEVSGDNPFEGDECLARELDAGEWAWITGIGEQVPMNLDLTGIDFDEAFIEFYIDSGTVAIGYMELRIAGIGFASDTQFIIKTDGVEGYEQIKIPLTDFTVKDLGMTVDNLKDFTGGTNAVSIWSIGFSPGGATTVFVDNLRIADSEERGGGGQAVEPSGKLATSWAKIKSEK